MNTTIAALVCAPFLVTALAAQSATRGNDPSSIGSPGSVDPSLDGLAEASGRSSDGLEWKSTSASPSHGSERLEGRPGDIVVAFLDDLEPGEYSLGDLPLRSAVPLGVVGNDGQFEIGEVPDRLVAGTVSLAVLPLSPGSAPGPLVARVCRYTLPSGPIVCGCTCTPAWDDLGGGANLHVSTVRFMGKRLFAGGIFDTIGGIAANQVARWNGNSWNAMQGGLSGHSIEYSSPIALSLEPYKGRMYAGGHFFNAGTTPTNHIASFKGGTGWFDPGGGVHHINLDPQVNDMVRFNDGGGNDLYVGGNFVYTGSFGGLLAPHIARWDGSTWSDVGGGVDRPIYELGVFSNGGNDVLVAGGAFNVAGGVAAKRIAQWDGSTWAAMGAGVNGPVYAIEEFAGDLYVAGSFNSAGGGPVSNIARWDGSGWSDVGGGTNGWINDTTVFDDGTGPALFVTGFFTTAGGTPANFLAKWDGNSWSTFAGGQLNNYGLALDSKPGCLAVGGFFTSAGGTPVSAVATWGCGCP